MTITKLSIESFKGINQLSFEPKQLNIIVGRNNTGKTSILQAIDLVFNSKIQYYKQYHSHLSSLIKFKKEPCVEPIHLYGTNTSQTGH